MTADHFLPVDVSRETFERLQTFAGLVQKWTKKINLISKTSSADVWNRHIRDSLQLLAHFPEDPRHYVDLGSGGGFPGIVLAIALKKTHPATVVTLIESDKRKAAFLRTAAQTLDLSCRVLAKRIEDVQPQSADVVTARALAPLNELLFYVQHHLSPDGIALLPKGVAYEDELQTALASWRFSLEKRTSVTDPAGVILKIGALVRA